MEEHDIVQYSLKVLASRYFKCQSNLSESKSRLYRYVLRAHRYPANEIGRVYESLPIMTDSKSELRLKMAIYGLKFEDFKPEIVRNPDVFGEQIIYAVLSVVPMQCCKEIV